MYNVRGGIWTNTEFKELEPGTAENYGPFATYEQAFKEWSGRTWAKVDTCCHRLFIEQSV